MANSAWGPAYLALWQKTVGLQIGDFHMAMPLQLWINDGLMAVLFIAGLALEADLLNHAKIGIMVGSLISAVIGMAVLLIFSRRPAGANVDCQIE